MLSTNNRLCDYIRIQQILNQYYDTFGYHLNHITLYGVQLHEPLPIRPEFQLYVLCRRLPK